MLNVVVHEFSAKGVHVRSIGRRGRGPGEFVNVGIMAFLGDSVLVVDGGPQIQAFDYRSGRPIWQRRLPSTQSLSSLATNRGKIFYNSVDRVRRTTVGMVATSSDSARYGGPFPAPLGKNKLVDQFLTFLQLTAYSNDSVAVALMSSDYLFLGKFEGVGFDSVHIARVLRRGARPELLRSMTEDPPSVQPHLYSFSVPWALGRLSSGNFGYVTADQTFMTNRLIGTLYLSVVNPRTKETCPDAEIQVPRDPHPWAFFSGDALLVVSQDLLRDKTPRTVVRRFSIHTEGCQWQK